MTAQEQTSANFKGTQQGISPPFMIKIVNQTIVEVRALQNKYLYGLEWTGLRPRMLLALQHYKTRSTQRAQTSLADADHYSDIAHCKNVEPWL